MPDILPVSKPTRPEQIAKVMRRWVDALLAKAEAANTCKCKEVHP